MFQEGKVWKTGQRLLIPDRAHIMLDFHQTADRIQEQQRGEQAGKNWGTTEDEMAGWHHPLNGHEFKQILGNREGQGSLACFNSWGPKEPDTI